jgi:hypothetical protein
MNELTTYYFEVTTDSEGPFPVLIIATGLKTARGEIQKTANLKNARQITEQEFQKLSGREDTTAAVE